MSRVSVCLLSLILIALGLSACDQQPSSSAPAAATTQPTTQKIESAITAGTDAVATNTSCPVSGEKVDPQSGKMTYQGQAYGFCCDDCLEMFKANPGKFTAVQ